MTRGVQAAESAQTLANGFFADLISGPAVTSPDDQLADSSGRFLMLLVLREIW